MQEMWPGYGACKIGIGADIWVVALIQTRTPLYKAHRGEKQILITAPSCKTQLWTVRSLSTSYGRSGARGKKRNDFPHWTLHMPQEYFPERRGKWF